MKKMKICAMAVVTAAVFNLFVCQGICQEVSKKGSEVTQKIDSEQLATVTGIVKVEGVQAIRGIDYEVWGAQDMASNFSVTAPVIKVSEAKGKDGNVIASLSGKTLRVLGESEKLIKESYENKKVIIQGSIKDNSVIYATSVSELK
jgi:hypothetical protein